MTVDDFVVFKAIAYHLFLIGLSAIECFQEIRSNHGPLTPEARTIRQWYLERKRGTFCIKHDHPPGRTLELSITERIRNFIRDFPKASTHFIADVLHLDMRTVKNQLLHQLHMVKKSVRWIPHMLTEAQKVRRMEAAAEIAQLLEAQKKNDYRSVITGDETWIYLDNPPGPQWMPASEPRPTFACQTISSLKVMVVIFFSGERFWLSTYLPPKETMGSEEFEKIALNPLLSAWEKLPGETKPPLPLFLHMDNAPSHRSTKTSAWLKNSPFIRVQYPPYSPDLAPCDFWLFGMIKSKLQGKRFSSIDQVMEEVNKILAEIKKDKLKAIFDEWKERCKRVSYDGEYCE
jgi:histone-lysine N-methyltransferase SETMAR